jgi:hypothetical protein
VELARPHQDLETLGEAVDLVRGVFGSDPVTLTLVQAREVVRKEIAAGSYPSGKSRGPDYSALMPAELCNCPDCRRARGEMPGGLDDGFFEDEDVEEKIDNLFSTGLPPGMPPELAKVMIEVMKEGFLRGESPEETMERVMGEDDPGPGFRRKGKKGKRK